MPGLRLPPNTPLCRRDAQLEAQPKAQPRARAAARRHSWLLAVTLAATAPTQADDAVCEQPLQLELASDADAAGPADERLVVDADNLDLSAEGLSQLSGGVTLRQGGREFRAERLDYDQRSGEVVVETDSVFRTPDVIIGSKQARFDLRSESGNFFATDYALPSRAARGSSAEIRVSADGKAELYGTRYTTCGPSSDAWYIEASSIELDHDEGLGSARNVKLRFLGVPILWTPYLQFPIDDQRRSGLLYPSLGQSDRTGFDFAWPVYINLMPNADAIVTPRYMSERGLQLSAEGRYLLRQAEGQLAVQHLENDRRFGDARTLVGAEHHGLLNRRLAVDLSYTEVSDRDYFQDLGSNSDSSSISHLERHARLVYQSPGVYRVQGAVQSWQPISSSLIGIEDPYIRLPQILFDARTRNDWFHTRAGIDGELVNFSREDSIEGVRTDLQPYLRFERDDIAWYTRAQGDLRYTAYTLSGVSDTQNDAPSRMLPVLSAEGGLRFERTTASGALQTLEPRGFALYVPYENQDDLPLFDTGEPDFGFSQLFARNRFSGADRLADAQQVAGSLTTRWLDPTTGIARWSASVGQLFRFEPARVGLPDTPGPPSGATEFISELQYRFSARWLTSATNQWSPREDRFDRASLAVLYRDPQRGQRLDLVYRYRRDLLEQTDVAVSWPVYGGWRVAGRSRFSIADGQSLDTLAGLEYETCCWAIRTSYRRYLLNEVDDYNSGVYLQLELKGLASMGTGYQSLLPGYGNDAEDLDRY